MRKRDKIENYLFYLMRTHGIGECVESSKSRYFKVNEKVLRVSDHIGKNSSGCMSIIVKNEMSKVNEVYAVHSHSTGQFQLMTYDEVKELCRTFFRISAFMFDITGYSVKNWKKEVEDSSTEIEHIKKHLSAQQSENAKLLKELNALKASSTAANVLAYQKKVAEIQSERDKLRNEFNKYREEAEEKFLEFEIYKEEHENGSDCVKVINEETTTQVTEPQTIEFKSFEQLQNSTVLGIDFSQFDENTQKRLLQDFAKFFSCNYTSNKNDLIFGYPRTYFTDKQLRQFVDVVDNYKAQHK